MRLKEWYGQTTNPTNCIKLESGEYLCDVTYFVNTLGNNGYVVTENDARIIVVWLENGLFAKEMMSY